MTACPSCSADVVEGARFCSSCGSDLDVSSGKTLQRTGPPRSPSSGIDHGRFAPGTMFASRYRIVAQLGKGGMGEVYRADDMKLSQGVALKLLPREFGGSEERRQRLLAEVRMARQISNPHVCRVYDVGEFEGEHFITMEYVQGEDLASLLHRIGRFPKDKGVEVARQICAGLAAAHERGVLHRDLKPANVMLDERGRVRLTDFGLAAGIDDMAANASEGTPAYMAPEQLAGREVTVRSDIYALGLVLYEIFTGKRAFSAASIAELREMRAHKSITDPSRIVDDLDPAVERVILRCLEEDPRERPQSALSVAAALPGGDPLAAALAAGETPSPELLAAAGDNVGLKPSIAIPLVFLIVIGAIAAALLHGRRSLLWYVDADLPPEALALKARETLRQIGYVNKPSDTARGWEADNDRLTYIREHDKSPQRWQKLRHGDTPSLLFWYRESPRPLAWSDAFVQHVTPTEPAMTEAGMITMRLDPEGHLVSLEALPDPLERSNARAAIDWRPLLAASGLDTSTLRPATPKWLPKMYADTRAAWEGKFTTGEPLRIEAAALNGRAVYFAVTAPWTRPPSAPRQAMTPQQKIGAAVNTFIIGSVVVFGGVLARRNMKLGRGDRRGATRIATAVLVLGILNSLLYTNYVADDEQVPMLISIVALNMFFAALGWLLYVALEPYMRRRWPHALIAWGKVLAGRFRDPLVGRDLLIGLGAGVTLSVAAESVPLIAAKFGIPLAAPLANNLLELSGPRFELGVMIDHCVSGMYTAFFAIFFLMLFRLVVRREWIAMVLIVALFSSIGLIRAEFPLVLLVSQVIAWSLLLAVMMRFGLMATVALIGTATMLNTPAISSLAAWNSYAVWMPVGLIAVAGVSAFYTSLAGRPIFREAFLEG